MRTGEASDLDLSGAAEALGVSSRRAGTELPAEADPGELSLPPSNATAAR
jgi:hypothetical protein